MNVTLKKVDLKGNIYAPTSKSYTHRYLIASMLSINSSTIKKVNYSNDILATLNCLASFGCNYKINNDNVTILSNTNYSDCPVFDCNESGSTLRFFVPIALSKYNKVIFKGTKRLLERGIDGYENIFKKQDIKVIKEDNKLYLEGNLKPGEFVIDGSVSSQYITGLLFTLPLLNGNSVIKIIPPLNSKNYVDITLDILSKYSIDYKFDGFNIYINGNQKYIALDYEVEADFSNAAFLCAFNYFNNNINVLNINNNSLQGDKVFIEFFKKLDEGYCVLDISNCIDLGPVLMTFAALKHGAKFIGCKRLKVKESDRANAIASELKKVNVDIKVYDDEVIVNKSNIINNNVVFDSHNDHRIVMSLSLISTLFDIKINDVDAVKKSYPHYFEDLIKLGAEVIYED